MGTLLALVAQPGCYQGRFCPLEVYQTSLDVGQLTRTNRGAIAYHGRKISQALVTEMELRAADLADRFDMTDTRMCYSELRARQMGNDVVARYLGDLGPAPYYLTLWLSFDRRYMRLGAGPMRSPERWETVRTALRALKGELEKKYPDYEFAIRDDHDCWAFWTP